MYVSMYAKKIKNFRVAQ